MTRIVDVSITGPDPDWLASHTRSLVDDGLAACGNIIPTIRSIYRWQGNTEDEAEAYVVLHTRAEHVSAIIDRTNKTHPYDTVHILATEIVDADPHYRQWIIDETANPGRMTHRSRVCHFVIDVAELDAGQQFWTQALWATEEPVNPLSRHVYRKLRLPDSEIRVLLQQTTDERPAKSPMHLDVETDDVEAEVRRLEQLGARRLHHRLDRGYDFWVMLDPWGNEFCVLQTTYPDLLQTPAERSQPCGVISPHPPSADAGCRRYER